MTLSALPIERLELSHVRNLTQLSLTQLTPFTVLIGANGSGKTSILEAIYLLASGRSFRTSSIRHVVQHGQLACQVYVESALYRIGSQRDRDGAVQLRLNGQSVDTQSAISQQFAVQLIEPEGMNLLDAGSKSRRQLLDWLMFHVEPIFYPQWLLYSRALRQRNALLKSNFSPDELAIWESQLAQSGLLIDELRAKVLEEWQPVLQEIWHTLGGQLSIEMTYQHGFDVERGLAEVLRDARSRDAERGHTQAGVHRADLRIKGPLGLAEHSFSRGQKKLLIVALRLSQVVVLARKSRPCVVLLDDLTAELDRDAQHRVLAVLQQCGVQTFITALDASVFSQSLLNDPAARRFHLEQGILTACHSS